MHLLIRNSRRSRSCSEDHRIKSIAYGKIPDVTGNECYLRQMSKFREITQKFPGISGKNGEIITGQFLSFNHIQNTFSEKSGPAGQQYFFHFFVSRTPYLFTKTFKLKIRYFTTPVSAPLIFRRLWRQQAFRRLITSGEAPGSKFLFFSKLLLQKIPPFLKNDGGSGELP